MKMFPPHISAVLDGYEIPAAAQAALYDLYLFFGSPVLEAFADLVTVLPSTARVQPEDLSDLKLMVVDRFLERWHPRWLEGAPTPSLYHPREAEGRAAGSAAPVGDFNEEGEGPAAESARLAREIVGKNESLPRGILIVSRHAHFGGRANTVSFDIVAAEIEHAKQLGRAAGRQHTLPGSAGATTGAMEGAAALLWEIQPNVYKPEGMRNREISALFRKHRNWHVATLTSALIWLRTRCPETWILKGSALELTHEVNPAEPIGELVPEHYDRTVHRVCSHLGIVLDDARESDRDRLLGSVLMNSALAAAVSAAPPGSFLWRVHWRADA
ncbi:MAG TPA: hypothetical protein VM557_10765 [Thermoanaerobaculia bacterium]|nr:hypothetical protein [Thermoanaerobaculia bacterium]